MQNYHKEDACVDRRVDRYKMGSRLRLHCWHHRCRCWLCVAHGGHQVLHVKHVVPPLQVRLHAGDQLLPVKRLVDPIIAAELQTFDDGARLVLGGDHDDGQFLGRVRFPLLRQDVEAVDTRHHEVQQDEIGHDSLALLHVLQALRAAHADDHGETTGLQHGTHDLLVHVVVVHGHDDLGQPLLGQRRLGHPHPGGVLALASASALALALAGRRCTGPRRRLGPGGRLRGLRQAAGPQPGAGFGPWLAARLGGPRTWGARLRGGARRRRAAFRRGSRAHGG
mmetsp:Transcript_12906/g.36778  ORF Transcript_12906/g.36778 Transcript_12906/m.36778 type:complete len:280 (-) Transcript_12906:1220-2059(-)